MLTVFFSSVKLFVYPKGDYIFHLHFLCFNRYSLLAKLFLCDVYEISKDFAASFLNAYKQCSYHILSSLQLLIISFSYYFSYFLSFFLYRRSEPDSDSGSGSDSVSISLSLSVSVSVCYGHYKVAIKSKCANCQIV